MRDRKSISDLTSAHAFAWSCACISEGKIPEFDSMLKCICGTVQFATAFAAGLIVFGRVASAETPEARDQDNRALGLFRGQYT